MFLTSVNLFLQALYLSIYDSLLVAFVTSGERALKTLEWL